MSGWLLMSRGIKTMDMSRIEKIDDTRWTVLMGPGEDRAPVILFGTESLLLAMDDKVLEQILNTSRLPGLEGSAMTMPDAHWGYGFPIVGGGRLRCREGGCGFCRRCRILYFLRNTDFSEQSFGRYGLSRFRASCRRTFFQNSGRCGGGGRDSSLSGRDSAGHGRRSRLGGP